MNKYIIDDDSLSLLRTLISNLIRSGSLNFVGLGLSENEILSLKTRLEVLEKYSENQKLSKSFEKLQDSVNNMCSSVILRMESRGLKEIVVGSDGVGPFDEDLLHKARSLVQKATKKKKYNMSQKKAAKIHYYLDQLHTIYLDIDVDDKKADKILKLYNHLENKFNLEEYWLDNPRTF